MSHWLGSPSLVPGPHISRAVSYLLPITPLSPFLWPTPRVQVAHSQSFLKLWLSCGYLVVSTPSKSLSCSLELTHYSIVPAGEQEAWFPGGLVEGTVTLHQPTARAQYPCSPIPCMGRAWQGINRSDCWALPKPLCSALPLSWSGELCWPVSTVSRIRG